MVVNIKWISENYSKFNNLYWGGKLPNIRFKISRSRRYWGFASFRYDYRNNIIIPTELTISNYYDSPENVKLHTLLHEMIHIADYTFHPEHFIRNHKRVSRSYDVHGYWFMKEAERINKFGWHISNIVTNEEVKISSYSATTKKNIDRKKSSAVVCIVNSKNKAFAFKTDINKIAEVKHTIKSIGNREWKRFLNGEIENISFYKTSNEAIAIQRSCSKRLNGYNMEIGKLENYIKINNMEKIK